ncbi:hypothetical protein JOB18_044297 [Solea senegalensis]|uniref:Uncharacterized protein n=1 Tax=Solea senegalensis TaxID=28829 RepID=A0AAV6SPZ1_SOLSE|nr:hypothetical protein JOB18_044297 [Solea senegalensis]
MQSSPVVAPTITAKMNSDSVFSEHNNIEMCCNIVSIFDNPQPFYKLFQLVYKNAANIFFFCTRHLLNKVQQNMKWARLELKPSKCRSISITKGKLSEPRFYIGDKPFPMVVEKPIKSLGRWTAPTLVTGRKWIPAVATQQAKSKQQHQDTVSQLFKIKQYRFELDLLGERTEPAENSEEMADLTPK